MKLSDAPMWSLGYFDVPPPQDVRNGRNGTWAAMCWETQITTWVEERVGVGSSGLHVRSPGHIWSIANHADSDSRQWHQDGPMHSQYIGVWSNTLGTEIKKANPSARKIYQPEPMEFLLFHNGYFVHRPPPDATEEERQARWFVRLYTSGPLRRHPDILECLL